MAYIITTTSGTTLATVADGTINTSASSLVYIGKNYAGYGAFQNENFTRLLENFSNTTAPNNPLTGQLWFDSSAKLLKMYEGTQWKPISSTFAGNLAPSLPIVGDLWWDTTALQLKVWSGAIWVIIGPAFSTSGTSGAIVETIVDTLSVSHVAIKFYINNSCVAILSRDQVYTPQSAIAGFTTIVPGLNLISQCTLPNAVFSGTSTNTNALQGLTSTQFLRSDQNTVTSYTLGVDKLNVSSNISIENTSGVARISNTALNQPLEVWTNNAGVPTRAITVNSSGITANLTGLHRSANASTIASASNLNLNLTTSNTVIVTGTTQINNIVLSNGSWRKVIFPAGITIAYNATTNSLNSGGQNIVTQAGDTIYYFASSGVVYGEVTRASGDPVAVLKAATGGGNDKVFYENDQVVTTSYTLTTGKNAVTAGPITINNGATVTVPDDQSWSIV
jgi:hypothetical protein